MLDIVSYYQRFRFRNAVRRRVCVVACNCWGAEIYRELRTPYLTPFVGLFVYPGSFVSLCEQIDHYLCESLSFDEEPILPRVGGGDYPVGTFAGTDVQLHFLHYSSPEEARAKWRRRADRARSKEIPKLFMFCDRDGASTGHFERFDALPASDKVCFSAKAEPEFGSIHVVKACEHLPEVIDGKALYPHTRREFDLASWVNGNGLRRRGRL